MQDSNTDAERATMTERTTAPERAMNAERTSGAERQSLTWHDRMILASVLKYERKNKQRNKVENIIQAIKKTHEQINHDTGTSGE